MTAEFCDLLYLFSATVHGETNIKKVNSDIRKVLALAERQGIWTVIFPAVKTLYQNSETDLSKEEFEKYNLRFTFSISTSLRRKYAITQMVRMLEEEGISCCMLKGEVLAELYKVPETRISSDTDILLESPDLEEKVCEVMEKHGFEVLERPHTSHHAMCRSKQTGLIEFHLSLHDKLFEDVWFNRLHERFEEQRDYITRDGNKIKTLGITDGAVFVALHFIKHFLSEGAGIRQLMDSLLYLRYYKNEIKWDKFNQIITELKYDKFLRVCIEIGKKYLGFVEEDFHRVIEKQQTFQHDSELITEIFTDIEEGGIFGHDVDKRKNFYKLYTEARYNRFKDGDFEEYMKNWGHVSMFRRLFPTRKTMNKKYSILGKHPNLLFVMYVVRIGKKIGDFKNWKKTNDDYKRLEMIKKLDMI